MLVDGARAFLVVRVGLLDGIAVFGVMVVTVTDRARTRLKSAAMRAVIIAIGETRG